VPTAFLYLHCNPNDAGGSVHEMARNFDLELGKDYSVPQDFNAGVGYPVETVNKVYNAADLCITTTLGEGWGFITTEAMAAKTPIVAPYITSIIDIFGGKEGDELIAFRGIPVKAGSTSSEWICMGMEDNERIRPLTNVDDMVEKIMWAYTHPAEVQKIVDASL
jgi:glycosyltransferase involved in cell wall biosynthesis